MSRSHLRRGQTAVEYAAISTILLLGLLGTPLVLPVGRLLMEALQDYVDFVFYSLNVAVG